MPIYDFKCLNPTCLAEFEEEMPIEAIGTPRHDSPICPDCGRIAQRVIKFPRLNNHPWRTKLADQPGEIQAIEAGMYEKDSSIDADDY